MAALGLAATGPALAAPAHAAHAAARTDVVLEWYDVTTAALKAANIGEAGNTQVVATRDWAVAWLAATRAVNGLKPPRGAHAPSADAQDAAVAQAVHDVLVNALPSQKATLDTALAATLGRLKDGRERTRGVNAGRRQAALLVADRTDDGLDVASVNAPYTPPAAAPGVWQPTPPAFATPVQSGQRYGETFLLGRANRFRVGPPPALGSATYLADLSEVRRLGSATSTERTPQQTDTARFWAQTSSQGYTSILRAALAGSTKPLRARVRIVGVFNAITTDAQIAAYEAKYVYLFWRPVTAIRTGPVDPDPTWTPLITTPAHPEYPSGHATFSGAAEVLLGALVGPTPRAPITVTSPAAPGVTRTYTTWSQATQDVIDARVWSGIHFRNSDVVGADLGRTVARYDLARLATQGARLIP